MNAIFEIPKSTTSVDHLFVADAGVKGKGTFAVQTIKKGAVIQRCPGLMIRAEDTPCVLDSGLFPYLLANPADYNLADKPSSYAVMLGSMTYCNHSDANNAVVQWAMTDLGLWFTLRALREVLTGEEVTMKYTNLDDYAHQAEFSA